MEQCCESLQDGDDIGEMSELEAVLEIRRICKSFLEDYSVSYINSLYTGEDDDEDEDDEYYGEGEEEEEEEET